MKQTYLPSVTGEAAVLSLNPLAISMDRVAGSSRRQSSLPEAASKHMA